MDRSNFCIDSCATVAEAKHYEGQCPKFPQFPRSIILNPCSYYFKPHLVGPHFGHSLQAIGSAMGAPLLMIKSFTQPAARVLKA